MQYSHAFLHASTTRPNGDEDTFYTVKAEVKYSPLWWQEEGLSYTASGYGSRIPSLYMAKFNGKWRRVYIRQYSNNGTAYIGKLKPTGENITVQFCY